MTNLKTTIHTKIKNGITYKYEQTGNKYTRIVDKPLSATENFYRGVAEALELYYRQVMSEKVKLVMEKVKRESYQVYKKSSSYLIQEQMKKMLTNYYRNYLSENVKRGLLAKKEREKLSTLAVNQSK